MKNLLTILAVAITLALPTRAQCGGDDVGSMPAYVNPGTALFVNSAFAGVQHWTSHVETIGADSVTVCSLDDYVLSIEGIAYFLQTGAYAEPSLEGFDPQTGTANPPTLESSWKTGGTTHTVKTPKQGGDSSTTWAKKHQTAVEALQKLYPPDPPETAYLNIDLRRHLPLRGLVPDTLDELEQMWNEDLLVV